MIIEDSPDKTKATADQEENDDVEAEINNANEPVEASLEVNDNEDTADFRKIKRSE